MFDKEVTSSSRHEWWHDEIPKNVPDSIRNGMAQALQTKVYDVGCNISLRVPIPEGMNLTPDQINKIDAEAVPFDMYSSAALKLMYWRGWRIVDGWDASAIGPSNALGQVYGDLKVRAFFKAFKFAIEAINKFNQNEDLETIRMGGDEGGALRKLRPGQTIEQIRTPQLLRLIETAMMNQLKSTVVLSLDENSQAVAGPVTAKRTETTPNSVYLREANVTLPSYEKRQEIFEKFYPWLTFVKELGGIQNTVRIQILDTLTALYFDEITYAASKEPNFPDVFLPVYTDRTDVIKRLTHDKQKKWNVIRIDILGILKYLNDDIKNGGKSQNYEAGDDFIKAIFIELHMENFLPFLDSNSFHFRKGADWYVFIPNNDSFSKKENTNKMTAVMESLRSKFSGMYEPENVPLFSAFSHAQFDTNNPHGIFADMFEGMDKKEDRIYTLFARVQDTLDIELIKDHREQFSALFESEEVFKYEEYLSFLFNPADEKGHGWNRLKRIFPKFTVDRDTVTSFGNLVEIVRYHINTVQY